MKLISNFFLNEPDQWGLRGDPHMWKELKKYFNSIYNTLSQKDFEEELDAYFNHLVKTKGKPYEYNSVRFEHFPQYGMSGGHISLDWWKETGLPLLKERYYRDLISDEFIE